MSTNLEITIGNTVIRLPAGTDAGMVVASFAAAQVFERDWNGKVEAKPDMGVSFAFVDPRAYESNPALDKAKKEAEDNSQRWYKAYQQNQADAKRIAELEAQLSLYRPSEAA